MKTRNELIILIVICLSLLQSASALEFMSSPYINNATETGQNIICYWNASLDTTNVNVSWYNSSQLYLTSFNVVSPLILNFNGTKRGETWTCEVTASNDSATISENVSVIIKNGHPKNLMLYNSSDNQALDLNISLDEDSNYTFYLNATDLDFDTLKFGSLFDSLPAGSSLSSITGIFFWTPLEADVGSHNVTFFTYDPPYNSVDTLSMIFNIIDVNDPPQFNPALANKQATEGIFFEYNITIFEEDNDFPLTFEIMNNSEIPGLSIQNTTNTTAMISFMPQFAQAGNHTIIIRVNDSFSISSIDQFNLEIKSTNHIPFITYLENVSASQNQPFLMHINASDNDTSDNITFSITSQCQGLWNITQLNSSANNSYAIINVSSLSNDNIICRQVTLSLSDTKATVFIPINLSLINVNDYPIIYDKSSYAQNSYNNSDINNLTAQEYAEFYYKLNFTDPDIFDGDTVNLSTNFTDFQINLNTTAGEINFVPNISDNFSIYIEASDRAGLKANKTLFLSIKSNSLPIIQNISEVVINESELFNFTVNATDPEDGSDITFYTNASPDLFVINNATGQILLNATQSQIGNYTIQVMVKDTLGAASYTNFFLIIINKNDPPILTSFADFGNTPLVAGHAFSYKFNATDKDLELPLEYAYDYLTFYSNDSWLNNRLNSTSGELLFNPLISEVGNYSILISVNDSMGLNDSRILSFTIYNISLPPNITSVSPYGPPPTNFGFAATSNFPLRYTTINISEDSSITFNFTITNDESDETFSCSIFVDGVKNSSSCDPLTYYFDFFSSGISNITLVVNDSHYSESEFTWIVNITNVNRPVLFFNNPINLTGANSVTGTRGVTPYFIFENETGTFYDADDDNDSDGIIDGNESNHLTFSYNVISDPVSAVNISIDQDGAASFRALKTGQAIYTFTASDGKSNATTGNVYFNMTEQTNQNQVQNSGSSGGTRTITNNVYYQIQVDKIITLDILAPKSVVMYENNTVIIPVNLKNNGNNTIYGIDLSSFTNNSEVEMSFDKNNIPQLLPSQEVSTNLVLKSYRNQGRYEVEIKAKAQNPSFTDTAVVLVSSIEKEEGTKDAETNARTMITYAQDLLSTNPKCLELNEMLTDVEKDMGNGNFDIASKKIDGIIKTCKYLTAEKELKIEQPNIVSVNLKKITNNPVLLYMFMTIFTVALMGVGYSIYYTNKKP